MPAPLDRWQALVEALRAYAAAVWHDEPTSISLTLRHLGQAGPLPLPLSLPLSGPLPGQTDNPLPQADRSDTAAEPGAPGEIEQAIVAVLRRAEAPLTPSTIARRAGRSYSGTFRTRLRQMTDRGELVEVEPGYFQLAAEVEPPPV